jgi:2',3'-cyclic-nucleotide 2'-phosphodiesterase
MKILFFGDIVGKVGREAVHEALPRLMKKYDVDFVIANGENASHGKGLTESHYRYLVDSGIDCITLGNHWHSKAQIDDYIDDAENLVRPYNLLNYDHGVGSASYEVDGVEVRVTNILGTAFLEETVSSPFQAANEAIALSENCIHIIDFHAESTSEKEIFAYYCAGRVSAVLGTHTHVQTNDARILEGGTAYMSDVGMCGDPDGVIGFEKNSVLQKIVYGTKTPFEINDKASKMINAVLLEIDEGSHKARSITPIHTIEEASHE